MTTFGELTTIARDHLDAVTRADVRRLTDAEALELLTGAAKCLRSCQLLWRTVDRPDRRFCDPDQAWQRAGNTLGRALTDSIRLLSRVTTTSSAGSQPPAAARLHAAAVVIGASHDLLMTHTRESRRGVVDLTGLGAVVDSTEGRRALATITASHIQAIVEVAEQVGRNEDACRASRESALRAGDMLHGALQAVRSAETLHTTVPELLSPVPPVATLRLAPVQDNESPEVLLREAVSGATRLHRIAREELGDGRLVRHTAGTMASIAVAMSTTQLVSSQAFRQVMPQVLAFGPRGAALASHLDAAARAAEQAGQAWIDVRGHWRGLRTPSETGPPDTIRREASDLVTRMGRLSHTDPAWRPCLDADPQLRTGAQLAPDLPELSRLLEGLRQLNAAIVDIAADHFELTRALSSQQLLLVRTRVLPSEYDSPRPWTAAPPHTVQQLAAAQHHAISSSRQSWATAAVLCRLTPTRHLSTGTHVLDSRRLAVNADIGPSIGGP